VEAVVGYDGGIRAHRQEVQPWAAEHGLGVKGSRRGRGLMPGLGVRGRPRRQARAKRGGRGLQPRCRPTVVAPRGGAVWSFHSKLNTVKWFLQNWGRDSLQFKIAGQNHKVEKIRTWRQMPLDKLWLWRPVTNIL
jgi:hypothetical protein